METQYKPVEPIDGPYKPNNVPEFEKYRTQNVETVMTKNYFVWPDGLMQTHLDPDQAQACANRCNIAYNAGVKAEKEKWENLNKWIDRCSGLPQNINTMSQYDEVLCMMAHLDRGGKLPLNGVVLTEEELLAEYQKTE